MTQLNDTELIKLAKDDLNNEAFEELVHRHSGIFINTVSRFCPQNRKTFWMQEIIEEKYNVFWDAISSFSEEKSQFHTWLANITKYKCKSQRTYENKKIDKDFIDDLEIELTNIEDKKSIHKDIEKNEIFPIIEKVINNKFSERDCKIFYDRFKKEKKLSEIAEEFELKPQRIEQIGNTILKELKKTLS